MPVLKNITIRNSRLVTPRHSQYGPQYSILISGVKSEVAAKIGARPANTEGDFWLNWNAQYPNEDPIAPITQLRGKTEVKEPTELGDGSVVDLAFQVQERDSNTYYNLRALKIMQFVAPLTASSWFDDEEFDAEDSSVSFDNETTEF